MEQLIKKLVEQNKSITLIENSNLKGFGLTISGYKDSGISVERFSVNANTSTNPRGIELIKERQNINSEYTDSVEKASMMASVASKASGSDFGIGVCGSIGAGGVTYVGIYDKDTKLIYKLRLAFDKNDVYLNKARIISTIKAQLIMLLNSKKTSKKFRTRVLEKQG